MVGPVKFDTARNPGAEKSDKRRLYNVLAVEKVIVVLFVICGENLAADFGENGKLNIIVFNNDGFVFSVKF